MSIKFCNARSDLKKKSAHFSGFGPLGDLKPALGAQAAS